MIHWLAEMTVIHLSGGLGNDTLQGSSGDDIYIYNRGDGLDTIIDGTGTGDTLVFGEESLWMILVSGRKGTICI